MKTLLTAGLIGIGYIVLSLFVEGAAKLFDMIPVKVTTWFFLLMPAVLLAGYIAEEIVYIRRETK